MVPPLPKNFLTDFFFYALLGAALWACGTVFHLYENPAVNLDAALLYADFTGGCLVSVLLGGLILVVAAIAQCQERRIIAAAWALKMVTCLGVMLWYEGNYQALDAYMYFHNAVALVKSPGATWNWSQGTALIPEVLGLVFQVTPVSYHAGKVVFAAMGLTGSWFFYEALVIVMGRRSNLWAAILMMFPSLIFWGSILGKDPLMLLLLGLFTWLAAWSFYAKGFYTQIAAVCAAIAVGYTTGMVRDWAPKIFVPGFLLAAFLWNRRFLRMSPGVKMVIIFWAAAVVLLGPAWWYWQDWATAQRDLLFYYRGKLAFGGSAEQAPFALTDWEDFFWYLPYGMFSSVFRPLPLEVPNIFGWVTGILNLCLLLAVLWSLAFGAISRRTAGALGFIGLICLIWAGIYGFISPANFGMGARFQLQILPFILMGCAVLLDRWIRKDLPSEVL